MSGLQEDQMKKHLHSLPLESKGSSGRRQSLASHLLWQRRSASTHSVVVQPRVAAAEQIINFKESQTSHLIKTTKHILHPGEVCPWQLVSLPTFKPARARFSSRAAAPTTNCVVSAQKVARAAAMSGADMNKLRCT